MIPTLKSSGPWRALLRPGDRVVLVLATVAVAASFPLLWHGGTASRVVVRRDGAVVAELPLTVNKKIVIAGPLGETVIEVQPGRARVLSDPGPRQYCVRQGWLVRPNAVAICAPNHISLSLSGSASDHDSLAY